ncbi:hypothetical protein [Phenylobacterium sp.]|uniref:hypothetical protein n=1 Tax=Phenylobacterium sp. TaxID=1871053 RepID=UPI002E31980A|nr:hypothetical protein [Phenylobacterium sp.]HEX3365157.1 hypothetical protein [Phenylobacterium sp.]
MGDSIVCHSNRCHPGRSAAESRDPGGCVVRSPLGPGSALRAVRDDGIFQDIDIYQL